MKRIAVNENYEIITGEYKGYTFHITEIELTEKRLLGRWQINIKINADWLISKSVWINLTEFLELTGGKP